MITRAGVGFAGTPGTTSPAAQRMPAITSESKPPHLPSTRTGSRRTLRPTLAMPMPLSVSAEITPATLVPCHELLRGSSSQPGSAPPVSRSDWVTQSPGSAASASRPLPSFAVSASDTMS